MATSTFIIDHERCDPAQWTPHDVLKLAKFIATGDLSYAAALSRMGVKLVSSSTLQPEGGTLQLVGYCKPTKDFKPDFSFMEPGGELRELCDDEDVAAIVPVYVGPMKFAGRGYEGDEDFVSSFFEIFETEEKAEEFAARFKVSEPTSEAP